MHVIMLFYYLSAGTVFIHVRQILTSVDVKILTHEKGPRAERIKIFIMAIDPSHRYSSEAERAN